MIEDFPVIPASTLQPQNRISQSFREYHYAKEVIAGSIRGELSIHQTEIKARESKIHGLGIFFKPSHSQTEIPLGLAAAPIQISPKLEKLNRVQKFVALLKTLYKIQVLRYLDKRLYKKLAKDREIVKTASSVPRLKAITRGKDGLIHFRTGYPADTLAQFLEQLNGISAEKIPLPQKRLLVLSVFKDIFVMLDSLPLKSHGDFNPGNILVSIQHEELAEHADQPIYTPSAIKTYAIDIGSIQNTLSPNLKQRKLFYTKQDDLQTLFTHLKRWWSLELNNLLGITQLTRETVMHMLEQHDKTTQQNLLSATIQDYQLQRLSYLLNQHLGIGIAYTREELRALSEKIQNIYKVDEDGEGPPTVIMPYTRSERSI